MAKQFFDVFPTLKLDKKMQNLFEQVLVEKVSATKGRDFIRVTVTCEYLIPKETVFRVEKEIKKQFFATHNVTVKLYERFRLSEQYTPRKLMDLYKESILLELRDHSPIEYSIFKGAVIDFPKEDELKLTIEDTVLARSKAAELSRILEKIFNERCGFSIACQMEYEEKEEGRLREEDDEKIARQIAQIAARAKGAGGGEGAYGQGSGETVLGVGVPGAVERNSGNAPQKDKKALSAPDLGKGQPDRTGQGSVTPFPGEKKGLRKGDFGKGGKGDFRRAVRRSDNPDVPIPFEIEKLTGINDSMVMGAPFIEEVLPEFLAFCKDAVLVAHNANFDMSFIKENALRQNIRRQFTYVDTVGIARILLPHQAKHTLDAVAKTMGVSLENHHRAVDDAEATAEIFVKFISLLKEAGADTLAKVNAMGDSSPDIIKRLPSYHAIILAENNLGRENLYRLVSESHLTYYSKRPRVPKSFLMKHREGLILGSACEAGELYRAILDGKPESEVARIVSFYDYLEIQPLGNNKFMIESERIPSINSMEDIMNINRRIVALGEEFNKPVVATCDVHFLNPEDEVYRRIIMSGKGFADADNQAPLYLRTTEEMLEEFAYLGSDKAEEVVITNTNRIADRIDVMAPVRPDKCPPVIPDSDKTLTDICYNRAHELYGEELPKIVKDRLEKELHSIITNGFAVMYIIAQKLVWKSVEDGYLVGSRGSVGSSLVAFMAGITEVNSLSAHYRCSNCFYYDFDSPEVKAFAGNAGCDMPDKNCPVCGKPLVKDGFDIPFETFLGFKGDKEPDIDLNFSGEYQSKAHKYTEVIFGSGQTYRAGTIATLADKTAFGYVKNYYEERGSRKRTCEINRIVGGCTGIRRSTGQHPGGIIVLPMGEDINSFTPVQHPANDMTTDIVTTHFDYHSIDHNLLKLDILGHDDPTMIRMLQDLTGIDPTQIPLDDPKVMSLFQNTSALGITPEQIDGCPVGSMGIPEFGTEFVIQMLLDTKPQCLSDLIRISGLGHGTDVWLGNAQTLILEGTATISSAICCRDDIMIYLINQGVDSALSFTIMESVRKGKGLKPEWEAAMKEKDVPDWYIWSCKKIKYMFPKAHAAAYVMMAWRIAYCKINYPLAYYAAFFSIRASAFSYEIMCQGQKHLESVMADYKRRSDTLSKKEQDSFKDMKIVQEMYARGYEFVPIDIFSAHSRNFQIVDGKLMPSLNSIDGLGERAADAIVEAAKDGAFLSKDDFRQRTKVSKTVIDLMDSLNLLGDLPESNQISLFDFVS